MKKFYVTEKKETAYVLGTLEERTKLNAQGKSYLMPLVLDPLRDYDISVIRNEIFYTAPIELRNKRTFLNNSKIKSKIII